MDTNAIADNIILGLSLFVLLYHSKSSPFIAAWLGLIGMVGALIAKVGYNANASHQLLAFGAVVLAGSVATLVPVLAARMRSQPPRERVWAWLSLTGLALTAACGLMKIFHFALNLIGVLSFMYVIRLVVRDESVQVAEP